MPILIKVHETYREVIAVCDSDLVGKKFEEGKVQLEINEAFFSGKELNEDDAIALIKEKLAEDACFNFVGKNAVEVGIKAGAVDKDYIMKVQGIPYAMVLV